MRKIRIYERVKKKHARKVEGRRKKISILVGVYKSIVYVRENERKGWGRN